MIVFERKVVEVCDYSMPHRVNVPVAGRCEVFLEGERMEEIKEFRYLRVMLLKHGQGKRNM